MRFSPRLNLPFDFKACVFKSQTQQLLFVHPVAYPHTQTSSQQLSCLILSVHGPCITPILLSTRCLSTRPPRPPPAPQTPHTHLTRSAVYTLENTYMSLLDFGGINSTDAEGAIKRAGKGGMVAAKQLRGLVTLLEGVRKKQQ